jgi:hypothetical protein
MNINFSALRKIFLMIILKVDAFLVVIYSFF